MSFQQKKILIIDDDPQVHKMLSTVLTHKKYQVNAVLDSSRAFTEIQSQKPDLIILDIMMPVVSGIELCQRIREDSSLNKTLILMLSAKDTQSDRLKGLQYGADDYVTKPFHVSTLVHKIEHMLSKQA